jgi:hypothetical protein
MDQTVDEFYRALTQERYTGIETAHLLILMHLT